ncbi:unnamed protein product [Prunus brigantina]
MKAVLSPHMLLLKFLTHVGIGQVRGDQLRAHTSYILATRDLARATRESLVVSTTTMLKGKGCSDHPYDPRDESIITQAQPVEDLETVPVSNTLTDRQLKIGTSLSPSLRAEFIAFLKANTEVFSWHLPRHHQPQGFIRYEVMKLEADKLKTIGFIREVTYPIWFANSVLVKKTSGAWRMCQDYTNLNKACPDSFLLPRIDQLVDVTAGHELLSFIDAYSGYNHIPMHPKDRDHTTFIIDKGLYCYNVMPPQGQQATDSMDFPMRPSFPRPQNVHE